MKTNTHFFIISPSVLLRMNNTSHKVVGKIKTHISFPITFFFNLAVYEILWKHTVKPERPQMTVQRMSIAC